MFIGAIVFLAVVCTLVVTYLLHYCSQNNFVNLDDLPYKTPVGVSLTFLSSVLFSASLVMLIHKPLINTDISAPSFIATFANDTFTSSYETIGYVPENAVAETGVVMPTPLGSFQPNYHEPAVLANAPTPTRTPMPATTPTPSPDPTPVPSPIISPAKPAIVTNSTESSSNINLENSTNIFTISVDGKTKGYTPAFLNDLTIYKDLVGDTRVMITVDDSGVNFYNLDTNTEIAVTQLSTVTWEESYPNAALMDVEVEEEFSANYSATASSTAL